MPARGDSRFAVTIDLVELHDLLRLLALGGDGDLPELHDLLAAGYGVELLLRKLAFGLDDGFLFLVRHGASSTGSVASRA